MVVIGHHLPDAFWESAHDYCSAGLFSSRGVSEKLDHYPIGRGGGIALLRIRPIASNDPPKQENSYDADKNSRDRKPLFDALRLQQRRRVGSVFHGQA